MIPSRANELLFPNSCLKTSQMISRRYLQIARIFFYQIYTSLSSLTQFSVIYIRNENIPIQQHILSYVSDSLKMYSSFILLLRDYKNLRRKNDEKQNISFCGNYTLCSIQKTSSFVDEFCSLNNRRFCMKQRNLENTKTC